MALIIAILAFLILAALVYVGFFLIFKLGWVIAGKKRNKWPLILAGLATVVLFAIAIISIMLGVNKYVMPFMELVDKTMQKTEITTGIRPYTDPKYGFTINLFGGTEMSKWIEIDSEQSIAAAFDTNAGAIIKKNQGQQNNKAQTPISGFVAYIQKDKPLANVQEYLQEQANEIAEKQSQQFQLTAEPDFSVPNTVFLQGKGESQNGMPVTVYITFAAQDDLRYIVVGFVVGNPAYQQMVKDEIRSFRPAGMLAAPLPYNAAFTVPDREIPAALPQAAN